MKKLILKAVLGASVLGASIFGGSQIASADWGWPGGGCTYQAVDHLHYVRYGSGPFDFYFQNHVHYVCQ